MTLLVWVTLALVVGLIVGFVVGVYAADRLREVDNEAHAAAGYEPHPFVPVPGSAPLGEAGICDVCGGSPRAVLHT